MMQNKPQTWLSVSFGDVVTNMSNGIGGKQNKDGLGIPVSRIETIADHTINFDRVGFIADYDETKLDRYRLNSGDILFSHINSPAHLGKTALVSNSDKLYHGINLLRIIVNSKIYSSKLFNYYCKYTRLQGEFSLRAQHAVNQSSLNQKKLSEFEIPLLPLAEQKQIAAELDELLAQVDTIKARLVAIPAILKRFRQSVLAAAVSGKLTVEWREKFKLEKFDKTKDELDKYKDRQLAAIPESWQWLRFSDVAEVASNLTDPKKMPDVPHIAPNHIESGTGVLLEYTTIAEDNVKSAKHQFYSGQILYSKIRPYLAKVVIIDFDGLCSADMYPINPKINTKYLFNWLLTHQFTDWASNVESRVVLPKINQKDLGAIPTPVPSLKEQNEIVQRIEQLFTYADEVEHRVKDAQYRVNNLTQSILAKAFRGDLTSEWRKRYQDLISGENSAEALLKIIKLNKLTKQSQKKGK